MERKPYSVYTDYDVFYLEICRQLFKIIDELTVEYDGKTFVFFNRSKQ